MTRFIAHLEFSARAAGGHWTLNKNDERGTFIDALEVLKPHLPPNFISTKGRYPFSSYQKILTRARADWENNLVRPSYMSLITGRLKDQ